MHRRDEGGGEEDVVGEGEEEEDVLGAPMVDMNVEGGGEEEEEEDDVDNDNGAGPVQHDNGDGARVGDVGEEEEGGGVGQEGNAEAVHDVDTVNRQPSVTVSTVERAVAVLEEGRPIDGLVVKLQQQRERRAATTTRPAERFTRAAAFRRFVELLGDPCCRASFTFLILQGFRFVSDAGFAIDDVRALFGEVLPKKPGLKCLVFEDCEIDANLIRLLASALTTSPSAIHGGGGERTLHTLQYCNVQFDQDGLRAIAEMLTGSDLSLTMLDLDLWGMGPAACKLICGYLPGTRLQQFHLHCDEVSVNTLDHVAATSSLRYLTISAVWSPEAIHSLAKQLRTNTSLETLHLLGDIKRFGHASGDLAERFEGALHTYNYTLQFFAFRTTWGVDASRIERYLRRNRWIRGRLRDLRRPAPSAGLWPIVLEKSSGLPSLTYTLLRGGDINAFSDVLQGVSDTKKSRSEEIDG
jgi:hypothetical protein